MSVFRFESPAAFQFLWGAPILILVVWYLSRRSLKKIKAAFGEKLSPFLTSSLSLSKRRWKLILQLLVFSGMVFALARPQSGESRQKVKSEGVELMLLVDVSNSMMAEDIKPSRLEFAKKEIIRLIDLSAGDRMGVIAFAGSAILLSPVTTDKAALKMYIESLTTESVSTQGTVFQKALVEARDAFKRGGVEEDDKSVVTKAIVVVSDGEDHEKGAIKTGKELAEEGIRIFSLAIGTEKGAPIPVRDQRGQLKGYRKDKQNKVILSKTKGTILKDLATAGKGSFYHVTFGGNAVQKLQKDISQLEQTEFDSAEVTDYQEYYQWPLGFAILLAMLELLLGDRKSAGRIWKGRFEVAKT